MRRSSDEAREPREPACQVHELRASPEAEHELEWFFTEAERAVAMPSNFSFIAEMALAGSRRAAPGGDHSAQRRAEALHAAETIHRRLKRLSDANLDVLVALYSPDIWPAAFEEYFGEVAGFVARSPSAQRALAQARRRDHPLAVTRDAVFVPRPIRFAG